MTESGKTPERGRPRTVNGLGLGLAGLVFVSAILFGLLAFPSLTGGEGHVEKNAAAQPDRGAAVRSLLNDPPTRAYIRKFTETFPSAAAGLKTSLDEAARRGASEAEAGMIILTAGSNEILGSLERLSKADIRYFNGLLNLASSRLSALSQSGAAYCAGSDLVEYAALSEQQLYRAIFDQIGPGKPAYDFALEVNGMLLDAIGDARSNPKNYARPARSDMQALQTLGLAVLTDPDVSALLTTEGESRTAMDSVLERVNFCELGVRLIGRVDGLPEMTKERVWYEALYQLRVNGIRRIIWQLSTY